MTTNPFASISKVRKENYSTKAWENNHPLFAKSTNSNLGLGHPDQQPNYLSSHTLKVLETSLRLAEQNWLDDNIRPLFKLCIGLASVFHDLGKACVGFQAMILDPKVGRWPNNGTGGNRHEIVSLAIFLEIVGKVETENYIIPKSFLQAYGVADVEELGRELRKDIALAIVTHHKSFADSLNNDRVSCVPPAQWPPSPRFNDLYDELLINKERLRETIEEVRSQLQGLTNLDDTLKTLLAENLPERIELPEVTNKLRILNEPFLPQGYTTGNYNLSDMAITEVRKFWLLTLRGTLITADHLSSGHIAAPTMPNFKTIDPLPNNTPRAFQEVMGQIKGSVYLRAPTGSGKTEASLMWARANVEPHQSRIYYVLPFQASINAMMKRIREITATIAQGEQIVGLQHSKAALSLLRIIEEEQYEKAEGETKTKYEMSQLARQLEQLTRESYYPIKVTTPHQMLKVLLGAKGWETQAMDLNRGVFIFDEIHVYNPNLTGLIFTAMRTLVEHFDAKIAVMSATFPKFLQEKLNKLFETPPPLITLAKDQESDCKILTTIRHNLVLEEEFSSVMERKELKEAIEQKKTILIVCNTVSKAQEIAEVLAPYQPVLYHSRFKGKDRIRKEEEIQQKLNTQRDKPFFLVATQVVEVSLDYDFDIGVIQNASLDALVQRFGRVNRKGRKYEKGVPNIFIFKHDRKSELIYGKKRLETSWMILEEQISRTAELNEETLVQLINELYNRAGWEESEEKDYQNTIRNERLTNYTKRMVPGTYHRWVDQIMDKNQSLEVYLEEDLTMVKKINSLEQLGFLIPVRFVGKEKLFFDEELHYYVLRRKAYRYSYEKGLEMR